MIMFMPSAQRKSAPDRDPRIVHINQWQQLADKKREEALGTNFFEDTRDFFCLDSSQIAPRFRPSVRMPELQMILMKEANDLSEFSPQTYIYNQVRNNRMDAFENAFKAQWNLMNVTYHLLFAFVASQFLGTGFLHYGLNPYARNGKGKMWCKWRDSKTVHIDPNTDYTCNWSFVLVDDWMHLDEVKRQYPESSHKLPRYSSNTPADARNDAGSAGFRLPDGPWQHMPPFNEISASRGNSSRVQTAYFLDYAREIEGDMPADPNATLSEQRLKWKYPRGRVIKHCEGVVIADGPCPFREFPLIPVWATPPLYGIWSVPPSRYTLSLQDLAERTYAQTYENFYRMNNGIWLIPSSAEIDQGKFGGIPGEKATYSGEKEPKCVTPPAFPDSATKMPEMLLQKQRDIQGFTQARQGNPGQGNISPELFDASVLRSQGMTQLRGRLASQSVRALAQGIGYTLLEYMPTQKMPLQQGSEFSVVDYQQPDSANELDMFVNDGSFHVKSQAIVQRISDTLASKGIIPPEVLLEMLGYPDAAKIGQELKEARALTAVAAATEGPKGKK